MAANTSIASKLPNYEKMQSYSPGIAYAVVTANSTDLAYHGHYPRALYVGSTGNVTLMDMDGNAVQFVGLLTGQVLPVMFQQITAATAGSLVAIY